MCSPSYVIETITSHDLCRHKTYVVSTVKTGDCVKFARPCYLVGHGPHQGNGKVLKSNSTKKFF